MRVNLPFNQMPDIAERRRYPLYSLLREHLRMKYSGLSAIVFPLLLAALVGLGPAASARAEGAHEYIIAANDGYGLEDCLAVGSECGRVVADAWCEAHGHGHALNFGPRSAVDARATQVSTADDPYVVQCGD